ncbi:MAG TPA: histidine kinase [Candidatus Limnocylindria bacterium]|nr:histidine kinase [Candidatus Limnocylindria bacterium]
MDLSRAAPRHRHLRMAVAIGLFALLLALLVVQIVVEPRLAADPLLLYLSVVACALAGASRPLPLVAAAGMALLTIGLDVTGIEITESPFAVFLAVLIVAFHAGERLNGWRSVAALALLLAAELFVGVAAGIRPMGEWAAAMVANAALWSVGVAVRRARQRADTLADDLDAAERRAGERERQAVELERARIARELHDVIAHSVAVMTVQAGAAETALAGDPARVRDALRAIQETGRRTVDDLRHLLGLLRESPEAADDPQPGLDRLSALADEVTAAGLPVRIDIRGDRVPVSPGLDVAAYRIVQEALTNALRHGDASGADVTVEYAPSSLRLVVENSRAADSPDGRRGFGLVGMRERAAVFGGQLESGVTSTGRYRVTARLPLSGPRP